MVSTLRTSSARPAQSGRPRRAPLAVGGPRPRRVERLRASTPMVLTADDLTRLRGLGERIDLREVEEVYLPLSRLLNLYAAPRRSCTP